MQAGLKRVSKIPKIHLHFSGIRKCMRASSSKRRQKDKKPNWMIKDSPLTLFWSGVPVIRSREADEKLLSASYSWDSLFLSR